jgi:chromate transporter
MDDILFNLVLVFAPLSLLSLGGGQAIMAGIQHQTVVTHHWFTDAQFADLFAISRAAPGPNTLIASLIGWQLKGFWGMLVATLAIYIPSSVLFVVATQFWHRSKESRWRHAIERGLSPLALGLIFAGVLTIMESIHMTWLGMFSTVVSIAVLYFTKINPYYLMFGMAFFYTGVFMLS